MYVRFRLFAFKPNKYRHLALLRPLIFPIRDPSKRVVQVYFLLRDYLFFFFLNREFNNYSSCSVTKRLSVPREQLELINDIRDFITYFSLIGQKD